MHAPTPWKVEVVWSASPRASVVVDANGKAVDLTDHANQMLVCLAVNAHHKRGSRADVGKRLLNNAIDEAIKQTRARKEAI